MPNCKIKNAVKYYGSIHHTAKMLHSSHHPSIPSEPSRVSIQFITSCSFCETLWSGKLLLRVNDPYQFKPYSIELVQAPLKHQPPSLLWCISATVGVYFYTLSTVRRYCINSSCSRLCADLPAFLYTPLDSLLVWVGLRCFYCKPVIFIFLHVDKANRQSHRVLLYHLFSISQTSLLNKTKPLITKVADDIWSCDLFIHSLRTVCS